tara:strand:- start:1526 stop:1633 length:108 start_codon:yes stop_codon:yes gene_type:complete
MRMNEYVITTLALAVGVGITYLQFKMSEYDPDKDF